MLDSNKRTKYIIIDTETGGTYPHRTSLLSLYAMALDKNHRITGDIDLLVKPDDGIYRVQAGALSVNHIDLVAHDKLALGIAQAKQKFIAFLEDHSYGKTNRLIVMGHNPSFDVNFIKAELITAEEWEEYFTHRNIDTASTALFLQDCGVLPPHLDCKLTTLAIYFGFDVGDAHSAKADVHLCYAVCQRLMDLVRSTY